MNATKQSLARRNSKHKIKRKKRDTTNDSQLARLQTENQLLKELLESYFDENISKTDIVDKLQRTIDSLKESLGGIILSPVAEQVEPEPAETPAPSKPASPPASPRKPPTPQDIITPVKFVDRPVRRAKSIDSVVPRPKVVRRNSVIARPTQTKQRTRPVTRPKPTTPAEVPKLQIKRRQTPRNFVANRQAPLVARRPRPLQRKLPPCPMLSPRVK